MTFWILQTEHLNGAVTILVKVDTMGITMFYVILTVISVTILCTCYTMHCFTNFQWTGSRIIWFAQKHLGILYYEVFISDIKWCGINQT